MADMIFSPKRRSPTDATETSCCRSASQTWYVCSPPPHVVIVTVLSPSCASAWPPTPPACEHAPSSYESRQSRNAASLMRHGRTTPTPAYAHFAPPLSAPKPAAKRVATVDSSVAWAAGASVSDDSLIANPLTVGG